MSIAGRLVGKVAIVTGGGSGIGRAVCRLFAKEGASIAVLDVNAAGIGETLRLLSANDNSKHCAIPVDVSSADQAIESIKSAEAKLGKGSILVNAAGITRDRIMVKMLESQFDEVIGVNLKGTFLMAREFVKSLVSMDTTHPASIINISSIVAKSGNIGQTNYSASKAGVIGMTKSMALEYAKHDIRCNAVLPGFIKTPMTDVVPDEIIKMVEKQIPLKRQGRPEEIAAACLFLASADSSYITGTCLEVAGGLYA